MKRIGRFALLLLVLAQIAWSQDTSEWIYLLQTDRILVGNASNETLDRTVHLSRSGASRLHPTPGGKFVFVTFEGSNDVSVVDAETYEEVEMISFDFEPAFIAFSPMGETAYITEPSTNKIRIYDHRRAQFTYTGSLSEGRAGAPVYLNRRGTRLYRAGDEGLIFLYLKTGEVIDAIKADSFPGHFAVSPDYRFIWGVSEIDGTLIIVDENRGRISRRINLDSITTAGRSVGSGAPVFSGAKGFVPNGATLVGVHTRNFRVQETISLRHPSNEIAIADSGLIWSAFDSGVEILKSDTNDQSVVLDYDATTIDLAHVVVRSGEGFACF